jgi:DNA-3-methyladenine glycosylase
VARDLIGMVLVHDTAEGRASGVIVEVEAYIGEDDPACHAAAGPTPRNQPLYGPPGLAYVYFNYGMHWLVNAVTEQAGFPAAVLIRALAPVEGLGLMRQRRAPQRGAVGAAGQRSVGPAVPARPIDGACVAPGQSAEWTGRDAELCRGPGNLTRALGITGAQNRVVLGQGPLRIERARTIRQPPPVAWSSRVGIRVGQAQPWRAYVPGHPSVSGRPR